MTDTEDRVTSFRLEVRVVPSWGAILDWVAEEAGLSRDKIGLDGKDAGLPGSGRSPGCLWGKAFRFVWFQDRVSGLDMIWSDHHGTFVDAMIASDFVFFPPPDFSPPPGKHCYRYFVIAPEEIGFSRWSLGDSSVEPKLLIDETLATIPFDPIIRLLFRLDEIGLGCFAISEFPPDLAQDLEKTGTVYDTSDYFGRWDLEAFNDKPLELPPEAHTLGVRLFEQDLEYHRFQNRFYTLDLRFECFKPRRWFSVELVPRG